MKTKSLLAVTSGIFLLILFLCVSCSKDDEITNKDSFVIIELAGPLKNGSFKIETDIDDDNFQFASGFVILNPETNIETALLSFQDDEQDLVIGFAFPAKKGLNELLYNEADEYITITFLNESLVLVSQMVSLNITSFQKSTTSIGGLFTTFSARGTFTGTVVYVDSSTNTEYSHILTGEFEYYPI